MTQNNKQYNPMSQSIAKKQLHKFVYVIRFVVQPAHQLKQSLTAACKMIH